MLFNSLSFILFLPIVFLVYWKLSKRLKWQNLWVLFASYVFYGWWDWRFLSLIFASTLVDYFIGLKISNACKAPRKQILLVTSLVFNLGLLGVFKYFNFFIESFNNLLGSSYSDSFNTFDLILPVGISFYTFQTLSYTIDIYKGRLNPTRSFINFAGYVSFFPQLVAGPIERAVHLLPQFEKPRKFEFEKSILGLRQILWGLFKKVVIADNLAVIVDDVYLNYESMSSLAIIFGFISFSFQIYCDFSGYSDIAIGVSRLFGFDLIKNFNFPYFSQSISEFWRRWHISLTTWFRDYVYFPLGGNKKGIYSTVRNTLIVFSISGFWHGANWTFIFWGVLNAILFLPGIWFKRKKSVRKLFLVFRVLWTFTIITFTWIFFRSDSMSEAINILNYSIPNFSNESLIGLENKLFGEWSFSWALLTFLTIVVEFFGRKGEFALQVIFPKSKLLRWFSYFVIVFILGAMMQVKKEGFIYFQF